MRIVAISDQHSFLPDIPPCDLLLIAGDVCPDGVGRFTAMQRPDLQKAWFDDTLRPWLAASPATHKILTWGNHDWCGEACSFEEDSPRRASTRDLQILIDEATTVPVSDHPSAETLSIWASPWSNRFMDWAFMKSHDELEAVYAAIPERTDIIVSHQPPFGHGDACVHLGSGKFEHLGNRHLLKAIERVRPKFVVCGHIHEGHGRTEHHGIPIYNVAVVNEFYELVHAPTIIDL